MNFLRRVAIVAETMNFKSKVKVDAYGKLPGINFDYYAHGTFAEIKYSVSMNIKEYGIEAITVHVPDQLVAFEVEREDDEGRGGTVEAKVPLKNISVTFYGGEHTSSLRVAPETLTIHDGKGELIFS